MNVRAWQRILLGGILVGAVAVAGIALNFALLGLTQTSNDPVGKLSPRAVFERDATPTPSPTSTPPPTPDDHGGNSGRESGDD